MASAVAPFSTSFNLRKEKKSLDKVFSLDKDHFSLSQKIEEDAKY